MGNCYKFELSDDGTILDIKDIGNNNNCNYRDAIDVEDYEDLESEDINMDELFNENVEIETETKKGRRKKEKKPLTKKGIAIRAVSVFGAVVIPLSAFVYTFRNNIKFAFSNVTQSQEFHKYDNNGVVKEAEYFLFKVKNCLDMVELSNKLYKKYSGNKTYTREEPIYAEDGSLMNFDDDVYAKLDEAYNIAISKDPNPDDFINACKYIISKGPIMEAWLESVSGLFAENVVKVCDEKCKEGMRLDSDEHMILEVDNGSLEFNKINSNGTLDYELPVSGIVFDKIADNLIEILNADEVNITEDNFEEYCDTLDRILSAGPFQFNKNDSSIYIPAIITGPEEVETESESVVDDLDSSLSFSPKVRKRVL